MSKKIEPDFTHNVIWRRCWSHDRWSCRLRWRKTPLEGLLMWTFCPRDRFHTKRLPASCTNCSSHLFLTRNFSFLSLSLIVSLCVSLFSLIFLRSNSNSFSLRVMQSFVSCGEMLKMHQIQKFSLSTQPSENRFSWTRKRVCLGSTHATVRRTFATAVTPYV